MRAKTAPAKVSIFNSMHLGGTETVPPFLVRKEKLLEKNNLYAPAGSRVAVSFFYYSIC